MEDRGRDGYFCLLNSAQTRFYAHPANYPKITGGGGGLGPSVKEMGVKVATRLQLIQRLRMLGAIP